MFTLIKLETTVIETAIPVIQADIFVIKSNTLVLLETVMINILPITAVIPQIMPDKTLANSRNALMKICNVIKSLSLSSVIP